MLRSVYKKNPKFCTKKCADDFKRNYVERTCKQCERVFEIPLWEVNNGKGTFCTRECFIEYNGETSIEEKVRLALEKLGIKYQQEVKIGAYRADFLLPESKIVIECDGEYWHRSLKARERDKRKDEFLTENGYQIIRLSEEQIRSDSLNLRELL